MKCPYCSGSLLTKTLGPNRWLICTWVACRWEAEAMPAQTFEEKTA